MKLVLISFLFSFVVFSESKTNFLKETRAPVEVAIYYNPNDANSISFIKSQSQGSETGIFDLMLPETNYLQVKHVPWSNANTQTKAYECFQEEDCLSTRLQACAIEQHKNSDGGDHQIFHFILCTMSSELWLVNATQAAVQCVNQVGEWPDEGEYIVECAKDHSMSDAYLDDMKSQADAAQITQVPWVTINGERNTNAENNLKTEVCAVIDGEKPETCSNDPINPPSSSSVPSEVSSSSGISEASPSSGSSEASPSSGSSEASPSSGSSEASPSSGPSAPLKVGIFYNPNDANSISFIKSQSQGSETGIFDLMLPDTNYLQVNHVPWSNANTQTKAYVCPKEEDCLSTRLQACAIEQHKNSDGGDHQIFHFILCTMSSELWLVNATQAVVQCVNQVGEWPDDGEYIVECAKDHSQSDAYLDDMKSQADAAQLTKVPWVTINGVMNSEAETNLKAAVCNSIDGTKPEACSTGTGKDGAVEILSNKIVLALFISIALLRNMY